MAELENAQFCTRDDLIRKIDEVYYPRAHKVLNDSQRGGKCFTRICTNPNCSFKVVGRYRSGYWMVDSEHSKLQHLSRTPDGLLLPACNSIRSVTKV